jgi:CDP-4-dehydro-6-deoxyglucose reductase
MTNKLWFPTIDSDKCDGCKGAYKCVSFCPHDVLEVREEKAFVVDPLGCVYGCSACANLCPNAAIIFPPREESPRAVKKESWLRRVTCRRCGKQFLTDRKTELCFECEEKLDMSRQPFRRGRTRISHR